MARYALLISGQISSLRDSFTQPQDIPHKSVVWKPCPIVTPPAYDPESEAVDGPTYQDGGLNVVETWTKRALSPSEIDAAKNSAVNGLAGAVYKPAIAAFTALENEIRDLRLKLNEVIIGAAISVSKYQAQQTGSVTEQQILTWLKNNL